MILPWNAINLAYYTAGIMLDAFSCLCYVQNYAGIYNRHKPKAENEYCKFPYWIKYYDLHVINLHSRNQLYNFPIRGV